MKSRNTQKNWLPGALWTAVAVLGFGLLAARLIFPEITWLTVALALALIIALGALIAQNRTALRGRSVMYGSYSVIYAILVIAIVGVLNFLGERYPKKLDLTRNKVNTLSDQTVRTISGLNRTVKATLYSKTGEKEKFRPLLDNYKALSPKFEVEYVDPDREPARAKAAGIKKYGTLELQVGTRDTKVEDVTEEKITNSLIKILKEKAITICAVTGHGEKSFDSAEAEGYSAVKQAMTNQSYEVKNLSLVQDLKDGKIPAICDAVAVIGPNKGFFPAEINTLKSYLEEGGRAVFALDINLKGGDASPELDPVLESWGIKPVWGLIVDPVSRMLGVDATVPVVATFNKENPITKDFQGNCFFAFARPLDVAAGNPAAQGLTIQWFAQTTPKSWSVGDPKVIASGTVDFKPGRDKQGPLNVAVSSTGKRKDSKASRDTRVVVFGSSMFAANNFQRMGNNLDLFMNGVSWAVEDTSMISIRAKENEAGKVELSQRAGQTVFMITVILMPAIIAIAGIVIWARRRKL